MRRYRGEDWMTWQQHMSEQYAEIERRALNAAVEFDPRIADAPWVYSGNQRYRNIFGPDYNTHQPTDMPIVIVDAVPLHMHAEAHEYEYRVYYPDCPHNRRLGLDVQAYNNYMTPTLF